MDKKDLKIELRGVWYSNARINRVLEYRFAPGQKCHIEPKNILEKIERIFDPLKYDWEWNTEWQRVEVFQENSLMGSREFEDEYNWGPYWIKNREEFEKLKGELKTYGDLVKYFEARNMTRWALWKIERDKYLKENGEWR